MTTDIPVSDQTYQYFLQEASELLQTIDDDLQNIREEFSVQKVHNLMRAAHTLKGASASVGLDAIKKTTHSLEDVFKALCYQDTVISLEMEGLIFRGYDCLKLLMSAQLADAQVDEADILDRMAAIVTQLQEMLGDRFGQGGHLPTSSELGFDMTQSIFEVGVAQRIETLEEALEEPDAEELLELLETQAEVFMGLSESLDLPGFGEIATTTLRAIEHCPQRVMEIAPVALANYKAAHSGVLAGDRGRGGEPSAELQQFCSSAADSPTQNSPTQNDSVENSSTENSSTKSSPARDSLKRQVFSPINSESKTTLSQQNDSNLFYRVWTALTQTIRKTLFGQQTASTECLPAVGKQAPQAPPEASAERASVDYSLETDKTKRESETGFEKELEYEPEDDSAFEYASEDELESFEYKDELEDTDIVGLFSSEHGHLSASPAKLKESPRQSTGETSIAQTSRVHSTSSDSHSATIRATIKDLDQISQSMGELLTHHNRQALYNDQLTALVKKLLDRISHQRDSLNQPVYKLHSHPLSRRPFSQHLPDSAADSAVAPPVLLEGLSTASNDSSDLYLEQFDSLELDRYSDIQLLTQSYLEETVQQSEIVEAIELFVSRSSQELTKQKQLLAGARETLVGTRMLPLGKIFQRFPAALERLQVQYNKKVNLTIVGSDVLADKVIADKLYDPLLHLLRNAFDHGIESVELRERRHKPAVGSITLEARQQGRHLVISIKDDGQGLDIEKIRQKAVETQIITAAEADRLTPEQTIDLLFEAGFSTASEVDDLSGRGVGLDAVQAQVRSLKGWIAVNNQPGSGTCFSLHIPSSLTIAKLLLCQAEGRVYALITDAIEHILIPSAEQVRAWEEGKAISWQTCNEEHLIPVYTLCEVLNYGAALSSHRKIETGIGAEDMAIAPIILLRYQNTLVGVEITQLIGEQELVITSLEETISPPAYVHGSSILPDGQMTLVLDGVSLAKTVVDRCLRGDFGNSAESNTESRAKSNWQNRDRDFDATSEKSLAQEKSTRDKHIFSRKLILTVDDSITVRNTLSEALQKAEYQVIHAKDGAEALRQLERHPAVDAILCDIEMPGMNGFEFLKVRQQRPAIAKIPTIMLTSRKGSKHRQLTQALGATAYLTKPYLTPQLLETVAKVIESQTSSAQEFATDLPTLQNSKLSAVGKSL